MSDFDQQTSNIAMTTVNPQDFPDEPGYSSGEDSEVTTVTMTDPVLEQYQQEKYRDKWCDELEASRKEKKDFVDEGYKIIARWGNRTEPRNYTQRTRSNYNLFWRNTEMKRGAAYARTPQPDIKRRWNDPNDQVSRVAGMVLSRVIEYELDCQNFDMTMNTILNDRLVPGMGVAWLRLEQKGGQMVTGPHYGEQVPQTDAMTGQPVMDSDGNPLMVPHPLAEQMVKTPVTEQMAHVDHVPWDDFYWSPCRTWTMNRWVGRRIPMSKQAIDDRFSNCCPVDMLKNISYENDKDDTKKTDKDKVRTKNQLESTTDVYEIWDKELKLVWWVCESCSVPLDVQKDTNEFPEFFPTPTEPLGTFDGSNTIPYPDYKFTQDLYEDIDDCHNRMINMVQASIVRFTYNASNKELKDILTIAGELQGIPVNDWANFQERGGLGKSIEFVPLDFLGTAAQNLAKTKAMLVSDLDDLEGLNDILKAETATNETQMATQMKGAFGTTRLAVFQKQVSKYVELILRKKAHLICRFYDPQIIAQRIGTLTPEDTKLLPQAIQLLKNEEMRGFKLSISVDALQAPNQNLEKSNKIQCFQALSQAIAQALPAIKQNPEIAPLVLTSIEWLITGFPDAQYMEGEIDTLLQQLEQAAQKQAANPQQNKQPTPEQLKLQQVQIKAQSDERIAQLTEQTKRQDNTMDNAIEQRRLDLDQSQQHLDAQGMAMDAHDQMKNTIHDHAMDQVDAQHRAKDTIHGHAMDIASAQPDLTIVLPK